MTAAEGTLQRSDAPLDSLLPPPLRESQTMKCLTQVQGDQLFIGITLLITRLAIVPYRYSANSRYNVKLRT